MNKLIIFFLILIGVVLSELVISIYALVPCLISIGISFYISPKVSDELQERKRVNKEKKIARLEKELEDLKTEVI